MSSFKKHGPLIITITAIIIAIILFKSEFSSSTASIGANLLKTKVGENFAISITKSPASNGKWVIDSMDKKFLESVESKTEPVTQFLLKSIKSGSTDIKFIYRTSDNKILDTVNYKIKIENKSDSPEVSDAQPSQSANLLEDNKNATNPKVPIATLNDPSISSTNSIPSTLNAMGSSTIPAPMLNSTNSFEQITGSKIDDPLSVMKEPQQKPIAEPDWFITPDPKLYYIHQLYLRKSYMKALSELDNLIGTLSSNSKSNPLDNTNQKLRKAEEYKIKIFLEPEIKRYDDAIAILMSWLNNNPPPYSYESALILLSIADIQQKKENSSNDKMKDQKNDSVVQAPKAKTKENTKKVETQKPSINKVIEEPKTESVLPQELPDEVSTLIKIVSLYYDKYQDITAKAHILLAKYYAKNGDMKTSVQELNNAINLQYNSPQNQKPISDIYPQIESSDELQQEALFLMGVIYFPVDDSINSNVIIKEKYNDFLKSNLKNIDLAYYYHTQNATQYPQSSFGKLSSKTANYLKRNFIDYR